MTTAETVNRILNFHGNRVLRKPDYAASLAEDRVRNKEEELVKRHYRRTVKLLEDGVREPGPAVRPTSSTSLSRS